MFNQSKGHNWLQFLISQSQSCSVLSLSFLPLFYHFGIFCHKATSKISTEESSHKESPYNASAVEFSPLSHGQSITVLKNFSSTSLAPQSPCRCHFSHLFKDTGSCKCDQGNGPVIPHPPNKASPWSVERPLQFMHLVSEPGPWTFDTDLCQQRQQTPEIFAEFKIQPFAS